MPLWYWMYWYKGHLFCCVTKTNTQVSQYIFTPCSDENLSQHVNLLLLRQYDVITYIRGLGRGGVETNMHIHNPTDYLSVLCLLCSPLHCRLFGSKQWNHSPLSQSLIRRRIWGEWELTCEQRKADCDYSVAGALNRCWLCLLLHSSGAAQLLGHSGAGEQATAAVIIILHFTLEFGESVIKRNPSNCCGHLANITCWGFNCRSNPEQPSGIRLDF